MATHDFDFFAERLGIAEWKARDPGKRSAMLPCPIHGGSDSLHVSEKNGKTLTYCFVCGKEASRPDRVAAALDVGIKPPRPGKKRKRREVSRETFSYPGATKTRIDYEDGKTFFWTPTGTDPDTMIYGSEDVPTFDPNEPVIVVEGERKRDRLKAAGYQSISLSGGSSSKPKREPLKVLGGLDVILWPDNDDPGDKVMGQVAQVLVGVARSIRVAEWLEAPAKGDAADFLDSHAAEECDALLKAATAWGPGRPRLMRTPEAAQAAFVEQFAPRIRDSGSQTLAELLAEDLPPLVWVVEGLIPAGLGLVASGPKVGKSLLALQVSIAARTRDHVLDARVEHRPVLLYSLEDGKRVTKERALLLLAGRPAPDGFDIRYDAPRLGSGMEEEVNDWLAAHPNGLVWIDMLARVRPSGRAGRSAYDEDYEALGPIQSVAKRHPRGAVVLNTHDRKAGSDDFTMRVTGTRGATGAVDYVVFIDVKADEENGFLHVSGREVQGARIPVRRAYPQWEADALGVLTEEQREAYDWLAIHGPAGPAEFARETGRKRAGAYRMLERVLASGVIVKGPDGYDVPIHVAKPSRKDT